MASLAYDVSGRKLTTAELQANGTAEADGEVLSITIEACGTIDAVEGRSWLESGSTRLLVEGRGNFVAGTEICVTGDLRDQERPPRIVLGDFES